MELAIETTNRILYQSAQLEFSVSVAQAERYEPHIHPAQFQLELVLQGETECGIGRQQFTLPQEHYSLINPDVEHHNVTRQWKHALFLIFDQRILNETAWQLYRFFSKPIVFFEAMAPCTPALSAILHALLQEVRQPESSGRRLFFDTALVQVSVTLLRALQGNHTALAALRSDTSERQTQIARAVELIRSSFQYDLSLDDLAQAAGMSRYHFLRCFKAQMGETPYAYVMRTRLRAAAALLRSSSQAITEIALTCGFTSLSHFGVMFRRFYHCSPSSYRYPPHCKSATIQDGIAISC
jgi:AraC-like DNA-binding protein/quercetin dioxygenase-like cupin family protein